MANEQIAENVVVDKDRPAFYDMKSDYAKFLISTCMSVKAAMKRLGEIGEKELFVVDDERRLIGALSNGDIRRWILSEGTLEESVERVCNKQPKFVQENYHVDSVKQMMVQSKIECIPVVCDGRIIKAILTWDEIFAGKVTKLKESLAIPAVIMAGGKGTRLDPFTKILPKPLIPIGGKPIIEIIMDKLNEYGITEFYVTINHKAKMIKSYFEEMNTKYKIIYIEEEAPLGTAGGLKFFENQVNGSILVTNCDIIINSDYHELKYFHEDNKFDLTLVVSWRHYVIPYGICEIENGGALKHINEKPEYDLLVNTGMYMIKESVLKLIPPDEFFNVTDLIEKAKAKGYKIGVFPINERSWIDIGQWDEYHKAVKVLTT